MQHLFFSALPRNSTSEYTPKQTIGRTGHLYFTLRYLAPPTALVAAVFFCSSGNSASSSGVGRFEGFFCHLPPKRVEHVG